MDPKKAKAIFLDAVENCAPDEWPAYLDEACGGDTNVRNGVELLLAAHQQDVDLVEQGRKAWKDALPTIDLPITEKPGTLVGPYKLLEQIGEGGMGLVFMARQRGPVKRNVALKVIKPGMDSKQVIARFEAERQALAMMDHPNIAKVLDAGATESGRPYFIMELVHGIPLTEYCDQNELTTDQRLELFVQVCHAVQHAHQKGIIHRDIKPSNVMVTLHDHLAVPKIIDFGIAKATNRQLTEKTVLTGYGQMVGTPLYMSPEQAQMSGLDVDTRSDIYSLGVLLYELLTGSTPFDKERLRETDFDEVRRMIREEEPPRPSTRFSTLAGETATANSAHRKTDPAKLSHLLRGELDWIVMKALEKDRTRRYETASDLAKDVKRYLNDEPVEACPPTTAYRLGKFARRHKARLATIATCIALLVVATVGATAVAWNAHQRKTQLARAVNKELDGVRQSLETGDLAAAERKLTAARTRLDAARYEAERLHTAVDRLSEEVSARTGAEERFHKFQEKRERVFSRMYDLHKEEMKQAAKDCRKALDLFNIFGPRDWKRRPAYRNLSQQFQATLEDDVVELMFVMARLEVRTVTPDAWTILDDEDRRVVVDVAAHQRAIDVLRRIETVSRPTAGVYAFMSQCWREMGRTDKIQKTNAAGKKLRPTTALDYYILGELLAKRGDSERALERYGQALGHKPTHYLSLLATGDTLARIGRLEAAEMALTGAVTANPRPTFPYVKRALIRLRQDKEDLAMADFAEAARRDPTLAEDYDARGHWNLENGEPDQAISDWTAAVGLDPENAAAYFHRGLLYSDHKGEFDNSIADFSRTIQLDPQRAEAYYNRGIAYDNQGSFSRAAADFGEALTRGLTRAEVYTRRGTARALSGSAQLALEDYREAIRLDPNYAPAFFERGLVLCDCLGEFDRAIADFNEAIRIDRKQPLAYYNRAVACAAKGDLEGAVAGWTEAIRLDPRFARAYFERGILYCNGLDEYGKALADFNQVLRFAPKLLIAYYNRGIACYNRGDLDQALASWTRAIQLGFIRVEVFCSRGILYAKRDELQKAIADFDEAIRIDPQYAPAYNHRAAARAVLGQTQKASDDRAEAARLLEIQKKSTPNVKAAGEVSLATTPLTGQASPGRLVCASEQMTSCILRRTGSRLESRTMFFLSLLSKLSRPGAIRTGQAHLSHFPRPLRPRRLSHEPLEERQLLSAVSGAVFEDLDADGVRDAEESGLEGWTVALQRTDTPELQQTFLNPTPEEDDLFGFSVAAAGDNVLVGAHKDDTGATDAGAAYLFDGSSGELLQTFVNPTPEESDWFGRSIGALGDKVLVGANGDNTNGERAGAAYLFDFNSSTNQWEKYSFLNPTPVPYERFGFRVAAVGDNLLISAPWDAPGGVVPDEGGAGAAYLFEFNSSTNQWDLKHTFLNPTPEGHDRFGYSVAAVGSNVLIGAPSDDTGATDGGAAYLFDGTTGELLRTFLNPTPEDGDEFGRSVAAVGDNVLVSAYHDDTAATDAGAVYLFDGTTGELLRTFLNPTPEYDDLFGTSVAAVGNNVLIGASRDNINATSDGAAYLFDGATGDLLQSFLNPTPENWDDLGWSVAAVGDNVLTGVPWDNAGANNAGAAHLFEGPAPIPEPSTMTLLLGGSVCLLIHVRRLRRKRG